MSGQHSQQLLAYLLGGLEDDEHRQLEEQLRHEPALRAEAARLRKCLAPLENAWVPVCPPPGLAERTCRFVEVAGGVVSRNDTPSGRPRSPSWFSAASLGELARPGRWPLRDVVAAAALLIAVSLVLFPAIGRSRFQAAVLGCQDNMRQLGGSLKHIAASHGGRFPQVPSEGNDAFAGIYASRLRDHDLLPEPRVLLCPAVAGQRTHAIYVPDGQEIRLASPAQLAELRRNMSGDYGYHLPVYVNGRYEAVRDQDGSTFVILADSPSAALDGLPSANHGWRGQNVLFKDGSARYVRWAGGDAPGLVGDDRLFVNDDDEVAPGKHLGDAVIAPANARPVRWRP